MSTGYVNGYPSSGYASEAQLRAEFTKIQTALNDTVSRTGLGSAGNNLAVDLDMSLNDIINVKNISAQNLTLGGADLESLVQRAETAATNAETAETNAELAETNAETAQAAAEDSLSQFKGVWYGPLAADPTVDPNGDPIGLGDAYYNTASNLLMIYTSAGWEYAAKGQKGDPGEPGIAYMFDAAGTMAERSTHDAEAQGFCYYATDVANDLDAEPPIQSFTYLSSGQYNLNFLPNGQQSLCVMVNNVVQTPSSYSFSESGGTYTLNLLATPDDVITVREFSTITGLGALFVKMSATSGDWSPAITFGRGPRGVSGEDGYSIFLAGTVANYADLPTGLLDYHHGYTYLAADSGKVYTWNGTAFPAEVDGIQWVGPQGEDVGDYLVQVPGTATDKIMSQNAVMTAIQNALSAVGIGTAHGVTLTGVDLNNHYSNGFFRIKNCPNTPASMTDGTMVVVGEKPEAVLSGYLTQVVFNNTGKIYTRSITSVGAGWSAWSKFADPQPIGTVYVQYPNQSAPADLFGGTWTVLDYQGAFFRGTGGNAKAFGEPIQTHGMPTSSGIFRSVRDGKNSGGAVDPTGSFVSIGTWSTGYKGGKSDAWGVLVENDWHSGVPNTVDPKVDQVVKPARTTEVRPINYTIRIWKKTGD